MNSLYQISKLKKLLENGEVEVENQEEVIQEYLQAYAKSEIEALEIVEYYNEISAFIERLDTETKRIREIKNKYATRQDSIKKTIGYYLEQTGQKKALLGTHEVSLKNSESVDVQSIDDLPDECKRTKIIIEPDKVTIKDMLKKGQKIEGAFLVQNKNVIIK